MHITGIRICQNAAGQAMSPLCWRGTGYLTTSLKPPCRSSLDLPRGGRQLLMSFDLQALAVSSQQAGGGQRNLRRLCLRALRCVSSLWPAERLHAAQDRSTVRLNPSSPSMLLSPDYTDYTKSQKRTELMAPQNLSAVQTAKATLEEIEGFFVHLRLKLLTLPAAASERSAKELEKGVGLSIVIMHLVEVR